MAVFKQINSYLLVLSREYGAKSSLVLRSHLLFNIEAPWNNLYRGYNIVECIVYIYGLVKNNLRRKKPMTKS